tara:strand:- start:980 stop:1231 length:252 start_codon:yes stop_codon:yes gene_type:complete
LTVSEVRDETAVRAGAANAALDPANFALAPRTAQTAVTEEVVRAAIFANWSEAGWLCAVMGPVLGGGRKRHRRENTKNKEHAF